MTPEHLTALRQAAAEAKACGPLGALRTAVHGVEQLAAEVEQLTAERDEAQAAVRRVKGLIAGLRARDEIETDQLADMVQDALDGSAG